jgi:hypothetical protein
MPTSTAGTVYNQDVRGLASRINRFITEMALCASANLAHVTEDDSNRLERYIKAIRTYQAWIVAQPPLDLPKGAPTMHELDPMLDVPNIENEALRDVIVLFKAAHTELINSASARMPVGLLPDDADRNTRIVDKIEKLLVDYIRVVQPLDLPESSPQRAMSPSGKLGV